VKTDLQALCDLAEGAGAAIMEVYGTSFAVETKEDRSPLTAADRAAHEVISSRLRELDPETPVLSEEGRDVSYEERRRWTRLWVVDPLDGTKEFVKRNGEFTVNIALVVEGHPVLGVIYVPAQETLYYAEKGEGAWRRKGLGGPERIRVRRADPERGLTVVQSRSHPAPELAAYLEKVPVAESVSVGSSLKFCTVAEGRADLYPRLGPTMEWDTAAGQAIVTCAGGSVTDLSGSPLVYNKEDLHNPHFVVRGAVGENP
jgi:3'(2'), 5'-bisphosphate nucleotidase